MAEKRSERFRAANDAMRPEGHVDAFDNYFDEICDGCPACDPETYDFDGRPRTPLTVPAIALALEAA